MVATTLRGTTFTDTDVWDVQWCAVGFRHTYISGEQRAYVLTPSSFGCCMDDSGASVPSFAPFACLILLPSRPWVRFEFGRVLVATYTALFSRMYVWRIYICMPFTDPSHT